MIRKQETRGLLVRLPRDVKTWLEKESARTLASQNSEITRCIRFMMDKNQPEKVAG